MKKGRIITMSETKHWKCISSFNILVHVFCCVQCIKLLYWLLQYITMDSVHWISHGWTDWDRGNDRQTWATWSKVESRPLRKECSCRWQSRSARNNETQYGPVFGRLDRSSYSCWFFLSLFSPKFTLLCFWPVYMVVPFDSFACCFKKSNKNYT